MYKRQTLYTALVTVSKVAAPMIPFMTEEIYQNLVRSIDKTAPESIHSVSYTHLDVYKRQEYAPCMEVERVEQKYAGWQQAVKTVCTK